MCSLRIEKYKKELAFNFSKKSFFDAQYFRSFRKECVRGRQVRMGEGGSECGMYNPKIKAMYLLRI